MVSLIFVILFAASKSRECVKENCRPPRISSPIATPPHKRLRALQINTDVSRCQSSPVSSRSSPFRSKKISPRGALFSSGRRSSRGSPANNSAKKPSINPFTPDRTIKTANLLKNKTSCCSDRWAPGWDLSWRGTAFFTRLNSVLLCLIPLNFQMMTNLHHSPSPWCKLLPHHSSSSAWISLSFICLDESRAPGARVSAVSLSVWFTLARGHGHTPLHILCHI